MTTRRNFLLSICSLAVSAKIVSLFPLKTLLATPSEDGIVMRDGWILKETDL